MALINAAITNPIAPPAKYDMIALGKHCYYRGVDFSDLRVNYCMDYKYDFAFGEYKNDYNGNKK
jgi:hypothetical protein